MQILEKLFDAPTVNFCEKAGAGIIKRPYYAFTNVAFLLVAALIYFRNPKSTLNRLFAGTSLLVGILSFNYDALYIRWAQLLDLTGMFVFISFLLYLNLATIFEDKKKLILGGLAGVIILSVFSIFILGAYSGNIIFGLMVLAYILSEGYFHHLKLHTNYQKWYLALGLFTASFAYWITDTKEIICFSNGLFNGRSVFHYVTAICIYLLYTFYASQKHVRV